MDQTTNEGDSMVTKLNADAHLEEARALVQEMERKLAEAKKNLVAVQENRSLDKKLALKSNAISSKRVQLKHRTEPILERPVFQAPSAKRKTIEKSTWEQRSEAPATPFVERLRLHKQNINTDDIVRTTHFRDPSNGPTSNTCSPKFSDINDANIECYSGLRLKAREVENTHFRTLMNGRSYIPLGELTPGTTDSDINGDWVTIGVLVGKSEPRKSSNDKTYIVFKFSDLNGALVNGLLFSHVFEAHWKQEIGSVFAILNPRILPALEATCVGLDIDDAGKLLKFGLSLDMAKCKFKPKGAEYGTCKAFVDSRKRKHCLFHMERVFKKAKYSRAEFAAGPGVRVGDPSRWVDDSAKVSEKKEGNHSYLHSGGVIVNTLPNTMFSVSNGRVSVDSELSSDVLQSSSRGAKYLRKIRGFEQQNKEKLMTIFSSDALQKLGFDPISGKEVLSSKAESLPPSPQKATKHGSSRVNEVVRDCLNKGLQIPVTAFGDGDVEIEI